MDIILYLSNGYPSLDTSLQMAKEYADAGCGIIEIDFPSHDPYLKSKLIADRMAKALEACDDYDKYMEEIVRVKKELPNVKLLVLSYENTIQEIGPDKFIKFCLDNDLSDILINRNEFSGFQMPGTGAHNGGVQVITPKKPSSTRKYFCPCCGNSVRATKVVRIGCLDCGVQMLEV